MTTPETICAWVWDLPYPSKAQGKPDWNAVVYPYDQAVYKYTRTDTIPDPLSDPRVVALMDAANRLDAEYSGQMYGPALATIDDLRAALAVMNMSR